MVDSHVLSNEAIEWFMQHGNSPVAYSPVAVDYNDYRLVFTVLASTRC